MLHERPRDPHIHFPRSLSMTFDVAHCDTDAWLGLQQQLLASPNGHPSVIALSKANISSVSRVIKNACQRTTWSWPC